jgi:hypothetical protein
MEKSIALGYSITVRKCQTCGNETDDTDPCTAPSIVSEKVPYTPNEAKPHRSSTDKRPQFTLTPGSAEWFTAYVTTYNDVYAPNPSLRKGLSAKDAMMRDGWDDPDQFKDQDIPQVETTQPPIEPEAVKDITLDEVIEKMKKEQQ